MPSPVMNKNRGVILGPLSIGAAGTTSVNLDASALFEAHIQVQVTFGNVAGINGLQLQALPGVGTAPTYDTVGSPVMVVAGVASTAVVQTVKLSTGMYSLKLTNLDGTNGLTNVSIQWASIDSVQ